RDPRATPIVAVGALNPNGRTDAMFSNTGQWVHTYRVGASLVSTIPPFEGGLQPIARATAGGRVRESIDPDDFTGGFAVWSGTSFAAPVFAAELATAIGRDLPVDGSDESAEDCVKRANAAITRLTDDG